MEHQPLSRMRTALYLLFLVTVWGVNWPLSKYALGFSPPLLFAGLRIFMGGVLLVLFALPHYKKLRLQATWHIYLLSSLLNVILFYVLQTYGLNVLPAGMFSAIVFLQPVLLGIGAWIWLGEDMFPMKIIGLVLGFLGVAAISFHGQSGSFSTAGVLLGIGSAVSWALGTLYMKRTASQVDALWGIALQMFIGGAFLLILGSSAESWHDIAWNVPFLSTLLFISIFVTALGWLVFFRLVASGEASKVGSFTFLIPLTALVISVLFLGETVSYHLLAGLVLILASILLVNAKPKSMRAGQRAYANSRYRYSKD
ncbi:MULTISPECIES: DMT family transporter [Paenibacillus]|uniref:DMT family transporter n=1 Tax=Paenibacillus TaxID=44249 RepID=UPI0022B8762B|nr:DMT family transporter [Paenibacillus caseinilyticus]MCZ8520276.1 DMT family transporter [Paenibacillus caseinilyticus]